MNEAVYVPRDHKQLKQLVKAAGLMIVLGSRDNCAAGYVAELLQNDIAKPYIVAGSSPHHRDLFATRRAEATETEHLANIMKTAGIDDGRILLEPRSTNTGENALFSYVLVKSMKIDASSILLTTKPYMERRTLAHLKLNGLVSLLRLQ